ncbi:MAG: Ger(x)C family spore germination protein [Bacillota bacterium]
MKKIIMPLIIIPLLTGGCWDQRILEQTEIVVNAGMDARPGRKILVTVTAPASGTGGSPEKASGAQNAGGGGEITKINLYAAEALSVREAREKIRLQTIGRLEAGKVIQIFIGESLARRGVMEYLDLFERDPLDPVQARFVVVRGSANELLKTAMKWPNVQLPGLYFKSLLDHTINDSKAPDINFDRFMIQYYAPGIDPVLPLIKAGPERALVLGSALFRNDRMVGELSPMETFLLLTIQNKAKSHIEAIPLPTGLVKKKNRITIHFTESKTAVKLQIHATPQVTFDVKLRGIVEELRFGLENPKKIPRFEKIIAGYLTEKFNQLWGKLQAADSDPVGIGDMVRAYHNRYWRQHNWRQVYPTIRAKFKVKASITNYGVVR